MKPREMGYSTIDHIRPCSHVPSPLSNVPNFTHLSFSSISTKGLVICQESLVSTPSDPCSFTLTKYKKGKNTRVSRFACWVQILDLNSPIWIEHIYRNISVVSRKSDTGSKGYPLFRFDTGREGGCRSLHPEGVRRRLACRNKETTTQRSTQVQATRRLTALLLHVWTDVIMVVSYKLCSWPGTRKGGG